MIISVKAAFAMQCDLLNGGRKGSVAEWSKAGWFKEPKAAHVQR